MARLFSLLLLTCAALPAQADEHTVVVTAAAPEKGCVEVEAHGKRAPVCVRKRLTIIPWSDDLPKVAAFGRSLRWVQKVMR